MTMQTNRQAAFRNERFFLSNMFPCPVQLGAFSIGLSYPGVNPDTNFQYNCSEQAFQSMRTKNHEDWISVSSTSNGFESKKISKVIKSRPDWHKVNLVIMIYVVYFKFSQNKPLLELLLGTGNEELVEWNHWKDSFWGMDLETGKGTNYLGRILMLIRSILSIQENRFIPSDSESSRFEFDLDVLKKTISSWNVLQAKKPIRGVNCYEC